MSNLVDAQNPWLGLTSFSEETRGFFHGREEEGAELARRVQRKLLTVLFGQSGLGKTSLLQAGLVPRLRNEGFCPVYVRLDYHPDAPPPSEQIKRAVFLATEAAGRWTRAGAAAAGESLWEFLHHRDDVLQDPAGRTLTPIMIFDQFEEIFTLAQTDDRGRERARVFLGELADLVENRPPEELERRIDRDGVDAAHFDFARADYRIVISLREDYLANLEALKPGMPSVTQNRMRLARMTGAQAIAAVRGAAPTLVTEPVAAAIVRFVAGGAELAHAEVEPSLLSLICRELNNARLTKGQAEISSDLLAGSRDTILQEFYERAVGDQSPGVRAFIEDQLLTESGYRENIALERARKALVVAGADPDALDTLVNRRLLRVEERLDVRRVELMHDVLGGVVKASRDVRHEREAKLAVERQLADTRAQEVQTRQRLVRARAVAAVALVLMVLATASAGFGFLGLRRARAADAQARQSQRLAEGARGQSEKLVSFLLEDFYDELSSTGRIDLVGRLANEAVTYFDSLPPELRNRQSEVYRGMALARQAAIFNASGHIPDALTTAQRSRRIFEKLAAAGDHGIDVTVGAALARFATISIGTLRDEEANVAEAVRLLRPIVQSGRSTRGVRLTFADTLQYLGHEQTRPEAAIALTEEARGVLADMGALKLTDLSAASIYGDVTDSESRFYTRLGRIEDAERLSRLVSEISGKVLLQRPDDLRAMKNVYFAANEQAIIAQSRHDTRSARTQYEKAEEACWYYLRFNPADSGGWQNLSTAVNDVGRICFEQGEVAAYRAKLVESAALADDPRNRTGTPLFSALALVQMVHLDAQRGEFAFAKADLLRLHQTWEAFMREQQTDEMMRALSQASASSVECEILLAEGDYAAVVRRSDAVLARIAAAPPNSQAHRDVFNQVLREMLAARCEAALHLGQFEVAEAQARRLVAEPLYTRFNDKRDVDSAIAGAKTLLGAALVGLHRQPEAFAVLTEAEAYRRAEWNAGARETSFLPGFARVLYHLATAQPPTPAGQARRTALLAEASSILSHLSAEAKVLIYSQELAAEIARASAS